jgi:uncharacterized repeat protein (TIGR01451 family)/uncharacterized delta-60 repeat protein
VAGVPRSRLARLNADGTLDLTFDPALGADDAIYDVKVQADGKILVGGAFTSLYGIPRNSIGRFNSDGTIDLGFDPGTGCNDVVYSISLQTDNKINIGGLFTFYNQTRRVSIARLLPDGLLDTGFMDTAYNEFAGLPTHYWDPAIEPPNGVFTCEMDSTNVMIAGMFSRVGGGFARDDIRPRNNIARLIGGSTPGPGNLTLAQPSYSVDRNGGALWITLIRTNGTLASLGATFTPVAHDPGPGAAQDGVDYTFDAQKYGTPTYGVSYPNPTWQLQDGVFGPNQSPVDIATNPAAQVPVLVTILDNTNSGDQSLSITLTNPLQQDVFFLGGQNIPLGAALGRDIAPLTIIDYHTHPGVFGFSAAAYRVNENTNLVINVTRTNGTDGLVSVICQTLNGTATNNIHYRSNFARLTFAPGEVLKTFVVTNINEAVIEKDHYYNVKLGVPTGGATLGLSNAVVTITDDDFVGGYVQFDSATYGTNEDAGFAMVSISRYGGSAGTLGIDFFTTNITAISGTNYAGVTNTLTWFNGDVAPKIVPIRLYVDNLVETNAMTVGMTLHNATVNGVTNANALGTTLYSRLYITNTDFRGTVQFAAATNTVDENGGPAYINVVRLGGSAEAISVNFATSDATAIHGVDYTPTNGTLNFGPGEVSKTFTVPIIDNNHQDLPRFVALTLSNATPPSALGTPSTAILNIQDDESFNEPAGSLDTAFNPSAGFNAAVNALWLQPDGRILVGGDFTLANGISRRKIARLYSDGSLDNGFSSTSALAGANDSVLALAAQTDERILIAGRFTNVNAVARNYLARLNFDGSLDSTFNPGAGPSAGTDSPIFCLAESFVGGARYILVGGGFSTFNSAPQPYVVRLTDTGALDPSFNTGVGPNGTVYAVAVQADGRIVIGGDFTTVNAVGRNHIARLNVNGSLDLSFDPGTGANDTVRAITLQLDGRILMGGSFTNVNGVSMPHIARLDAHGAVDPTFNPGVGANDSVTAIAVQADTRIVLGGQFTLCNGVTRHHITRLNSDGTVDPKINFGDGANSFVSSLVIQPDRKILLGGGFSQYDGTACAGIARIYGGAMNGSGAFEFTAPVYQYDETATNATIVVRRRGGTSGAPAGNVYLTFNTADGTAIAGSNYVAVSNVLTFPPGEVFAYITIPLIHDFAITPDLAAFLTLSNPQPPNGPVLGNQINSLLLILNVDSAISFASANYSRNEDAIDGVATIPILRSGSSRGTSTVHFFTTTNGTAVIGTNYLPVTDALVTFLPNQSSNAVQVPVIHDPRAQGNTTVGLQLSNAFNSLLFTPFTATLTVVDVERFPGQLYFSQTNYVVDEGAGYLPVTVLRTNGRSGVVTANFTTQQGTAMPGVKYVGTNGVLTFLDGETNKTFYVPIIDENRVEGFQTFSLVLSNATGGAVLLAPTNVPVTIVDNDPGVTFASPTYVAPETAGLVFLTVLRPSGTNSVTSVSYATTNLYFTTTNLDGTVTTNVSAMAGTNYVSTSGTLTFTNGETVKTLAVQLLHDPLFTGDLSFGVNLFNPSAPAQLLAPSNAVVVALDAEAGLSFTNSSFGVLKSGTNVLITVLRSNVNNGILTVNYATSNGTAVAGVDYVTTSGTLTFSNGVNFQSFAVPIINNGQAQGDRNFSVRLFNPSPTNLAQVVAPSVASVTITDNVSGLSFSAPKYSVNENGISGVIPVFRGGFLGSTVTVNYSATAGSATAGINFIPVSGTLTFTNGETVKTFSVPVIDNSIVDGDHTVLLSLDTPAGDGTGQAVLVSPSSAVLNILEVDGSFVLPAGSALIGESGPVNGVIDTNETVTVSFGLRNASGLDTTNLTATLLPGGGIASPSGPQSYGVLKAHGAAASRPFTFTALGTNGSSLTATFQLRDGGTILSNAVFNLALGKAVSIWSNSAPIIINDFAAATPYPSTINVSGLNGVVTRTVVTLTNLTHTSMSDVNVVLVSPAGDKSYLMAKTGGGNASYNVTLWFDDTAPPLPQTALVSGTNRPTSYAMAAPVFPAPAPPAPYKTNLSTFNASNPNGPWSLYVYDDTLRDSGSISNGWVLYLTTALPQSADVGVTMTGATNIIATSNLTYVVTVANYGPASASNIVVSDVLPAAANLLSATPTAGSVVTNGGGLLTWSVGSLVTNATATLTLVVQPMVVGTISNTASVTASTADPNPDDNNAFVTTTVFPRVADVALGMTAGPNPAPLGANVTYTLTVTNFGPATAPAVAITNTLPDGVSLVSASPGYTRNGNVVTFTNLGDLGSGSAAGATIVVLPAVKLSYSRQGNALVISSVGATITNKASGGSSIPDPLKGNNTASAKVDVLPNSGPFNLESATNLAPPVTWTYVTGQLPSTNVIGAGNKFFRLHGTGTAQPMGPDAGTPEAPATSQ